MTKTELAPIRQRRSYPKTLKAQIVAECGEPGRSIASVALAHGINANLVHKWIRQFEERIDDAPAFVPILPVPRTPGGHIEIELKLGTAHALVRWPASDALTCAAWLSEWLR